MDNQINESYFINKSIIKNKNKNRHNKIKEYENVKTLIIGAPGKTEKVNITEFVDKRINRIKDKINKDTSIYLY